MTGFFKRWRWALGIAAVLMASLIFALRPQPVLVDVGRVSRGPMAVSIRDDGVTRAEDYYIVSAPVTGYMSRIDMDVGDTVRKNDRIATLIGTPAPPLDRRTERELQAALVAARANTQAIQASLLQAERDFDRAETLAVRGFFPKARLEQSRSTVASLKAMTAQAYAEVARIKTSLAQFSDVNRRQSVLIRAPVSGTVLAILTESEGTIAQGTPLVTLGDPAQIEAVVDLISREAAQVQRGAHVLVTQWGGNEPIKGRVARVEPVGRLSETLEMGVMVGIDPASDGLARAKRMGVTTTHEGIDGLIAMPEFKEVGIVFDATSAGAHKRNSELVLAAGKRMVDLTPAAIGPYVIPPVNGEACLDAKNVNMVTCGGQATIPIVHAVNRVAKVHYGEIVASISSKSAGPGTRANIDEFTETTSQAIMDVGGATRGKAIIILNPAEPPLIMRDTVYCLCNDADREAIRQSVEAMVAEVQSYVPGYRLKQAVQFEHIGSNQPLRIPEMDGSFTGLKVSVFLEVEGAAHYLPAYAGNLDIMTSAALKTAEKIAQRMGAGVLA